MSLTSFDFFLFLGACLILYYVLPKFQKYILLGASLFFFIKASAIEIPVMVLLMCYIFALTYWGGILLEKTQESKWNGVVTAISITGLVAVLFVLKYAFNMGELLISLFSLSGDMSFWKFLPVMGISYFTLSAIGYLLDVRWKLYPAERNMASMALFIFYFPQVISGPVTRFAEMKGQLNSASPLVYENIEYGLRRMLWGYFKKLVISERFAMIVTAVYENPEACGGADILIATLCYAVQLYTDFSGCMDIVLGASSLFGVKLPENFRAPFFSRNVQEFWQRWHITLGLWFKDYVMYPIQISGYMVRLGKKCRDIFGKKAGKKIPFYISMLVLWFLIGVWHGCTAHYFVASAIVPCTLLMISDFGTPLFSRMASYLPNQGNGRIWVFLQRVRTLLLICICWVFVCAGSVSVGIESFYDMFANITQCNIVDIYSMTRQGKGALFYMTMGIGVLIFADYLESKGSSLYEVLNRRSFVVRTVILYVEICMILKAGLVGSSEFIYFQF